MPTFTNQEILLRLESTAGEALHEYFEVDYTNPYAPRFKAKPGVIIYSEPGEPVPLGMRLDIANWFTHRNRIRAYRQKISDNPKLKPVVSAGDSWFSHPLLRDVINQLGDNHGFAVYSLDAAGAELSEIVRESRWVDALTAIKSKTLLVSGGGNDLMGDHFGDYLNDNVAPGSKPEKFLNNAFDDAVDGVLTHYNTIASILQNDFPDVKMFTHSYDDVIPRPKGPWLGNAMINHSITDPKDQCALIKFVLFRFAERLKELSAEYTGRVFYIPRRTNVPAGAWDDEIHPTSEGFAVVGANFAKELAAQGVTP